MKHPKADQMKRAYMYDGDYQSITGNVVLPPGIRIDRRVSRPREHFYVSQRTGSENSKGPMTSGYNPICSDQPFLKRQQRDGMPVTNMSRAKKPTKPKYK